MDERHARVSAGSEGDRSTHRVGLTRHCLASGLVQLPFALRNALPEGALLAHDVERDAALDLTFLPPRQLAGLTDFFAAHELRVNDEIELRLTVGEPPELRLVPVRRPRPVDAEAPQRDGADRDETPRPQPTRTASVWRSWREDGPSEPPAIAAPTEAEASAPLGSDPEVVDRFGSVTVRRLGTGRFGPAPTSVLADAMDASDAPDATDAMDATFASEAVRDAPPEVAAVRGPADARAPLEERPERLLGIDPDRRAPVDGRDEAFDGHAIDDLDEALLLSGPDTLIEPADPAPASNDPAIPPRAADDATDEVRGVLQASLFDAPASARPERKPAADPVPRRPRSRTARAPSARPVDRDPTPARVRSEAPASSSAADPVHAVPPAASDAVAAQRAREEALSRAGDLRSRIVRWMLAPSTPVIVSVEAVQATFDLPADVARDIVEGILESPPPSLRLTRLRADQLRVSKITVEHDA